MSTPISEQEKNRIKLQGFLEDKLRWHGHTHLAVVDDDLLPAERFVHTIGRARVEKPELIVTGCPDAAWGMDLIADVVAWEARCGELQPGALPPSAARMPLQLADVSTPFVRTRRVAQASSRFGADIRVFQIVWADALGRFPGEPDYDGQGAPQQALWDPALGQ